MLRYLTSIPKRYRRFLRLGLYVVIVTGMTQGCIPQKETIYFQNYEKDKDYQNPYNDLTSLTERYVLRPNDVLYIQVTTSNPKISEFFNPNRSTGSNSQLSQSLYTYLIDDSMHIDFPFVGKVDLRGCTLQQAKYKMQKVLQPMVSDAHVKMRLANNYFVILGEVGNPGRIQMDKEQITIFEAIGLAGDIKTFGKRKEIKIVRPWKDGYQTLYLDITDNNIVGSDQFYVYPNDIIYVRPMKAKSFGIGETFSFGMISSVLAIYLTIRAITQ
ncbi:polysaccharide biosynthesis/export family protein [Thermophagus sp. OGC60D27]|uniref:polysaccharide biosynthesis/export family protein n=1 Tax=Thermophagus sp. OGC60D27 TaxID=3458415 RepID=UPI004037D078